MKMTPGVTVNESIDERIKEFRNDPEKMNVTTKFVNEVVEKAKDEAMRRMKEKEKEGVQQQTKFDGDMQATPVMYYTCTNLSVSNTACYRIPQEMLKHFSVTEMCDLTLTDNPEITRKRGRWRNRARGFFSRLFASFCFCSPEAQV